MKLINMKKKNYNYEKIFKKRPTRLIWLILVPYLFLDVIFNDTTQE